MLCPTALCPPIQNQAFSANVDFTDKFKWETSTFEASFTFQPLEALKPALQYMII